MLLDKARKVIPGGVNSPVRSFYSIGTDPVFVKKSAGASIVDEFGKTYIDYCMSWGALIAGHANASVNEMLIKAVKDGTSFGTATCKEVQLAEMIVEAVPSIQKVRLTNSGTEATMSAVRLARGYTGRDKIIKFEGAYHGHADHLLCRAGSGAAALGIPDCAGVPGDFVKHTLVLPYNDPGRLEDAVEQHGDELAAIIAEPVMANCGLILPDKGFLNCLRKASDRCGAVLIFDEVISGFRLSYGGAQAYYGITPDVTCLGKIIGGGMPTGAFGGKKDIMDHLAPDGNVYQAGTLSGNPVCVTAGIAVLNMLKDAPPYEELEQLTALLCSKLAEKAHANGIDVIINQIASMFSIFFTSESPVNYNEAKKQDSGKFAGFYRSLLKQGIYLSPSAFETNFVSTMHSQEDVEKTANAAEEAFKLS